MTPIASYIRILGLQWVELFGNIRKHGLVGGDMSLGGGLCGFKRPTSGPIRSLCLVLVDLDAVSQLQLQHHNCLLAVLLSTMMTTDNSLQPRAPNERLSFVSCLGHDVLSQE